MLRASGNAPAGQIPAVVQQIELHVIGKMTAQCRDDLSVRGCTRTLVKLLFFHG